MSKPVHEPRWHLGGMFAGVAVCQFEQQDAGESAREARAGNDVRQFDAVTPAVVVSRGNDEDSFIERLRRTQREKNLPAPAATDAEFAPQRLLDALGGDGEQRGFEPDEAGVGENGGQTGERRDLPFADDGELFRIAARGNRVWQKHLRAGNGNSSRHQHPNSKEAPKTKSQTSGEHFCSGDGNSFSRQRFHFSALAAAFAVGVLASGLDSELFAGAESFFAESL